MKKKVIYVDIGHNVKGDNGAAPEGGLNENKCATQIGNTLIKILNDWGYDARPAFTERSKTLVTKLKDKNLATNESLRLRCFEANSNEADLFVSIHLNANHESVPPEERERGTSIFVRNSDDEQIANSILYHICNTHYDLGTDVFNDGTPRIGKTFKNNGVEDGRELYVIKNTNCPALLIETMYADSLNDANVYSDLAPYVNHEDTLLEEGVHYNCENVFSYNFFGFCIARGIDDYFQNSYEVDMLQKNAESGYIDLNYVCLTDLSFDEHTEVVINSNGFKDVIYGKKLCSIMRYTKHFNRHGVTNLFLPYQNFNAIQAGYASIFHHYYTALLPYKNLANVGTLKVYPEKVKGDGIVSGYGDDHVGLGLDTKAIEFKVRHTCNIYRSDGSPYTTLKSGSTIGVYLESETSGVAPNLRVTYETYNGVKGPIRCASTKPSWIKINYIINKKGEIDNVYNIFTGDDYAWLETNLETCIDPKDFTLILNV